MTVPRHAYPEYAKYKDDGCEYAPACLACPFPACKHDEEADSRPFAIERRDRDAKIVALVQAGHSAPEIARQFGVNERLVYRVTEGLRA